ncbi:hypothetical protein ACLKMY_12770 [Paraburkholderia mimosarum]|uniref:hypothetical protein n=1 Tax=Paraburkholderia mimosarum TaxID=312026 RepID=UPI0039C1AA1A
MLELEEEAHIAQRAEASPARFCGRIDKRELQTRLPRRADALREKMRCIARDEHTTVSRCKARLSGPFGVAPSVSGKVRLDDE